MKIAILILTHKKIDCILKLASISPNINFYIHVDSKVDINQVKTKKNSVGNIFFIDKRINIKWAGFSMVQATLNLMQYALQHDENNEYFHLISGDDVLLTENLAWSDDGILMECKESKEHCYRMRFNAPHADTQYQRSIIGKILTQGYKFLDRIFPTSEKFYFGSQWFSIRREQLQTILNSISAEDMDFFRKKLCPDEHFFQYLVVKNNFLDTISKEGNKRNIIFDANYQRGSSPVFLSIDQLREAKNNKFWFARKVEPNVMCEFYNLESN